MLLEDETVQFRAGYNAAKEGRELTDKASEDAQDGFNAFHLSRRPEIKPPKKRDYISKK